MPTEPRLRTIRNNGLSMRIAEMGEGPLVILVHGWPESWYSWRHQMRALAAAGYHVVAPDMRGYGGTDKPADVTAYDIHNLTGDVAALVETMGERTARLVGHDWGAIVAWNAVELHADKFSALCAMSVPYGGRGPSRPTEIMRRLYGENFYYILYFQQPAVAEAEFDADPRGILSRLYRSPSTPSGPPAITDRRAAAGGWIPRLGETLEQPSWLTPADLDYYVGEFTRSGFRGGINWYRNLDRNWETTPQLQGTKIRIPVKFLAGAKDVVIRGATAEALTATMTRVCTDFRGVELYPDAGHWIQQERAEEVNAALVSFFASA